MKLRSIITSIGILLILSACKIDVENEIYLSDLEKVYDGTDVALTDVVYTVEVPSKNQCAEGAPATAEILQVTLLEFKNVECVSEGFNSYLKIRAKTQIFGSKTTSWSGVTGISAYEVKSEAKPILVKASYSYAQFSNLEAHLMKRMNNNIAKLELGKIRTRIVNDTGADRTIRIDSAFVDGEPVINRLFFLKNREKLYVTSSDVNSAQMAKTFTTGLFYLMRTPKN